MAEPAPIGTAVEIVVNDRVALITLNRPEALNAWNGQLCQDLDAAMAWAATAEEVRSIVITGAGRAFCAGADLSTGADTFSAGSSRSGGDDTEARTPKVLPFDVPKPVIAALNGHAVGVGATYALACDIRFAADDAKIAFVFARRGMLSELGSHAVLPKVVGLSNAADLLLSGRVVLGAEAATIGLVSASFPTAEHAVAEAIERARDMALNSAPASMAISKKLLWHGVGLSAMRTVEEPLFDWVAEQADAVEGVASFLEKRPPIWTTLFDDVPPEMLP